MRLITDMVAYTVTTMPKWNPINICSYHLQEAGATPEQEIAYALSTAIAVLDSVRDSGQVPQEKFGEVVARISFFVNAGVRFVEEMCKMRAFTQLWDELTKERYGVEDPKHRRFRYGVQVNSLGLTEAQPENNVQRIVLEMLAVTLSRDARARAVQLPAWNEALGLPRPWDQQWSLRLQQVLAYETDLLEYEDLFTGSVVVEKKVAELIEGAKAEMARVEELGGAVAAVESGYMKSAMVGSLAERRRRIESGEDVVVGVNRFETTEPNPLPADLDAAIMVVDPAVENAAQEAVRKWRAERDQAAADKALDALRAAAGTDTNLMAATLDCARAGVTTGEWAGVLREVFGEYRAPTGVAAASGGGEADATLTDVRERVRATGEELGGRLRFLVGKPGLDGHSNGAEQIAVRARDAGFEVVYQGIRLTPAQIVSAAVEEDVHVVGLSVLSGSHLQVVPAVLEGLREAGLDDVPVVVGGIVPDSDARRLKEQGVARVFTPKDFGLTDIMGQIVDVVREANDLATHPARRWESRYERTGCTAGRARRRRRPHHDVPAGEAQRAVARAPHPAARRGDRGRRRATPPASCWRPRGRCSAPGTTSPTWPVRRCPRCAACWRSAPSSCRPCRTCRRSSWPACTRWPRRPAASSSPPATSPSRRSRRGSPPPVARAAGSATRRWSRSPATSAGSAPWSSR